MPENASKNASEHGFLRQESNAKSHLDIMALLLALLAALDVTEHYRTL